MYQLLDMVRQHLQGDTVDTLSASIGANSEQTQQAIGAILPTLLGGLAKR